MPDFFDKLSTSSVALLERSAIRRTYRAGALLFLEGDRGTYFYRLVSGSVRLFRSTEDGREVTIHFVEPGDLFAEIVLFERDTYPVSAVVEDDSVLSAIPCHAVHRLLGNEEFRREFLSNLVSKMRFLSERLYVLTTMDVRERLVRFVRTRYGPGPRIHSELSKKETATAIGVRPETLSRALRALEEEEVLTWKGRTITLREGGT